MGASESVGEFIERTRGLSDLDFVSVYCEEVNRICRNTEGLINLEPTVGSFILGRLGLELGYGNIQYSNTLTSKNSGVLIYINIVDLEEALKEYLEISEASLEELPELALKVFFWKDHLMWRLKNV